MYNFMIATDLTLESFMKKDQEKEKHRLVSVPTITSEPKTSSASITLQLLNKEKEKIKEAEKKESAIEAVRVRCRACFKEIAPKRLCFGHGHGHGGGGGGDSATSGKTYEEKASSGEDKFLTEPGKIVETTDEMLGEPSSEKLDFESSFDPQIIAELIVKGLLLVDSDRESMPLIIQLLCEPNALTEEQKDKLKKFMEAIIKEFNEFKEENDLSDDCMQIIQDEENNIHSLRITMPTLTLYDAFIQRLANNLVPIPSSRAQEKDEITKAQRLDPNPFSMKPKRSSSAHEKVEGNENKEQELFNPSPFKMKPW